MKPALLTNWKKQRVPTRRQVLVPIRYEDLTIDNGYRIDLLVGDQVVVELKAVEAILPVHRGQLLGYLKLGGFKLGFLLNFNVAHMRGGVVRMSTDSDPLRPSRVLCVLCGEVFFFLGGGECVSRR